MKVQTPPNIDRAYTRMAGQLQSNLRWLELFQSSDEAIGRLAGDEAAMTRSVLADAQELGNRLEVIA